MVPLRVQRMRLNARIRIPARDDLRRRPSPPVERRIATASTAIRLPAPPFHRGIAAPTCPIGVSSLPRFAGQPVGFAAWSWHRRCYFVGYGKKRCASVLDDRVCRGCSHAEVQGPYRSGSARARRRPDEPGPRPGQLRGRQWPWKGGLDVRCAIDAKIPRMAPLHAEETAASDVNAFDLSGGGRFLRHRRASTQQEGDIEKASTPPAACTRCRAARCRWSRRPAPIRPRAVAHEASLRVYPGCR